MGKILLIMDKVYTLGPTKSNNIQAHNLYETSIWSYNSGIAPQDDPFHPFTSDEWSQQTPTQMRTYLIQNLPHPHGPESVPSGPISSSRPTG